MRYGLHPIPSNLPLIELVINNRAVERSLLGIERWQGLEMVTATGVPTVDEVHALRQLPDLRHLVLHMPDPVDDLVRLCPSLGSLQVIELYGVNKSDVQAARKALGDCPRVEIRIHTDK